MLQGNSSKLNLMQITKLSHHGLKDSENPLNHENRLSGKCQEGAIKQRLREPPHPNSANHSFNKN
jgi:hypothetical protein